MVAPAGYGKSVAVAQWRRTVTDRPVVWVDLQRSDDAAAHLARTLRVSLGGALPAEVATALSSALDLVDLGGRSLGGELVEQLVRDFALVEDLVVVLDNYEVLCNGELIRDLSTIVTSSPPGVHFVIVSRSDPGIQLGRLRVAGDVVEVRADVLGLTIEEAATLLRCTGGITLDDDALRRIWERTSGWPAALQLAGVALRDHGDPGEFVERFSGDTRQVADYLTEEVLSVCGPDERTFLIETSQLDRLNPSLCDAATGGVGADAMLDRLERSGMLLTRLDGPGRWYRYHPLLSDLLRPELEHADPERHRSVLLRAASWHEQRGDLTAAVAYVVRARAWDELLEMTRVHGRDAFQQGLAATVRIAVDAIPTAVRLASPPAMLTRATLHLLTGQVDVANEELHRLAELHDLSAWELAVVDAERTAMVAWNVRPEQARVAGRRALERLAALDPEGRPVDVLGLTSPSMLEVVTLVALGRAEHYLGHDDEARELLDRAAARSEGVFLPWYLHSLGARALVEALGGNLRAATDLAAKVMHAAAAAGIDLHPATAEARLAIAVVRREQDQLDDASFALDEAGALIRSSHRGSLQCLYLAESAWLGLALGVAQTPVPELEPFRRLPAFGGRLAAARVRQRLSVRDIEGAALAIAAHDGPRTVDVDLAEVALAVARRELTAARRLVDDIDDGSGARSTVEQTMWRAVIDDLEGDGRSALEQIGAAAATAEAEGLRRVLLDAGPDVMRLVRRQFERSPTPFLRAIVERQPAGPLRAPLVPELVEQLTDREMAVLRYLPTRLSNGEIAQRLYVSLNTVKTHLKHIYRKLGASGRAEAIERAGRLGLL